MKNTYTRRLIKYNLIDISRYVCTVNLFTLRTFFWKKLGMQLREDNEVSARFCDAEPKALLSETAFAARRSSPMALGSRGSKIPGHVRWYRYGFRWALPSVSCDLFKLRWITVYLEKNRVNF